MDQKNMSSARAFVGNLPFSTTNNDLAEFFKSQGFEIVQEETRVIVDRETLRPRGFGFVQFKSREDMMKAIGGSYTLDGRTLNVSEANQKN